MYTYFCVSLLFLVFTSWLYSGVFKILYLHTASYKKRVFYSAVVFNFVISVILAATELILMNVVG